MDMPFTVIYTEPPRCKRCGQPMRSWVMFCEENYHDECWKEELAERLHSLFQEIKDDIKRKREAT